MQKLKTIRLAKKCEKHQEKTCMATLHMRAVQSSDKLLLQQFTTIPSTLVRTYLKTHLRKCFLHTQDTISILYVTSTSPSHSPMNPTIKNMTST